jgi:mono/diheme cytochrome c family protein
MLRWGLGIVGVIAVIGIGIWLSTANTAPSAAAMGDATSGEELFNATCAQCHGVGATGTQSGPPLVHQYYVPSHHADAAFLLAVRNGVRPHHWNFGAMPAIRGLSGDDVADIVTYVRDLQRDAGLIADGS